MEFNGILWKLHQNYTKSTPKLPQITANYHQITPTYPKFTPNYPKVTLNLEVISRCALKLRRFTPLRGEVHSIKEVHTIKRGGSLHKGRFTPFRGEVHSIKVQENEVKSHKNPGKSRSRLPQKAPRSWYVIA